MNTVSQMIARTRQDFENRLRGANTNIANRGNTVNTPNRDFQQELTISTNNAPNTEAVISPVATVASPAVADIDAIMAKFISLKIEQPQTPPAAGDANNQIVNGAPTVTSGSNVQNTNQAPPATGNTGVQNVNQAPPVTESSNSQPIGNGRDRWNIMGRYNIQSIRPANEGRYMDIITEMSEKHGVPVPLIQKIIEVESNFRSNAVSPAGARGLMQLMPATARSLGVTNSSDPRQNIEAGVRYIGQQLNTFDGDLVLALAAYNAGIGNVRRHNGVPPFRETINYINKITGINVSRA